MCACEYVSFSLYPTTGMQYFYHIYAHHSFFFVLGKAVEKAKSYENGCIKFVPDASKTSGGKITLKVSLFSKSTKKSCKIT